ncbi:SDR family NAD(P)-dependent oxidoreductase [Conexibacter arvalis]|uniref:NAD(P)-dependent dehydrogenase (Short-subunit alcohol dehydrogenase family) n=1 Tax=Conexibacter arvalis TaxID=912552 RepID=A0A840ICL4_9ACTN|nr:SDR family NAD(P)-dependent oxidoreductase [Conexibacter arvalis]MBB4661824.1 NAD(P)-dependent dehydrogenase (short-subunit alcohol dehydrogenase family) [Conexibacter arvalis]
MSDPHGKVLLVVGGASGIGLAAARIAAADGARVVIADVDPAGAEIAAGLDGDVAFAACDSTDLGSLQRAVDLAVDRHGRLDRLFATVGGAVLGEIDALDPETWERELTFNLTSAYLAARAALPAITARRGGAICFTSSGQAVMAATDRAGYAAAKAGLISYTRSLAAAVAASGTRVNCIAPGPTDTPRFRAMNGGDEGVERVRAQMPLGEIPRPEDCAEVALFLLSDAARQVTGQTVHVNGGLLMP